MMGYSVILQCSVNEIKCTLEFLSPPCGKNICYKNWPGHSYSIHLELLIIRNDKTITTFQKNPRILLFPLQSTKIKKKKKSFKDSKRHKSEQRVCEIKKKVGTKDNVEGE